MPHSWTSPEGFEHLVREHQRTVFGTLHRLTGPGAHLEDLAQEVFLRLYRALPEFRGESQLTTYLYRITVNVAQDEWKRRRRERTHFAAAHTAPGQEPDDRWLENLPPAEGAGQHTQTPEEHLLAQQRGRAVERALLALPETERTVLVLFHGEELTYEAIAAALQMPLNTVRTHLHRGRKRLAALVQEPAAVAGMPNHHYAVHEGRR